jgi:hypothetical protein
VASRLQSPKLIVRLTLAVEGGARCALPSTCVGYHIRFKSSRFLGVQARRSVNRPSRYPEPNRPHGLGVVVLRVAFGTAESRGRPTAIDRRRGRGEASDSLDVHFAKFILLFRAGEEGNRHPKYHARMLLHFRPDVRKALQYCPLD